MRVLDYEIGGLSIGGIETCIDLPSLKIAFDIGRVPTQVISRPTILFTHAHMDHMGGVAIHAAMRALRGMSPPTYVLGPENAESFAALFEAWRALDRSDLPHRTIVLAPGEEHALNDRLRVRPFRSIHRAPCQGYAILQRRHKLKASYRGREFLLSERQRVEAILEDLPNSLRPVRTLHEEGGNVPILHTETR